MLAVLLAVVTAGQEDVLAGDIRLDHPLSLHCEVVGVRNVLAEIGKQAEVKLQVEPALAEDLMVLFTKDRSAREIMARIAEHFDWTWKRSEDGYTLYRTDEQRVEESRALREQILEPYQSLRKRATELLESTEDSEKIMRKLSGIYDQVSELVQLGDHESAHVLTRQAMQLEMSLDPLGQVALGAIASLTDEQCLELDDRKRVVFATDPTRAQIALHEKAIGIAKTTLATATSSMYVEGELMKVVGEPTRVRIILSARPDMMLSANVSLYEGNRHLHSTSYSYPLVGADESPPKRQQRDLPSVLTARVELSDEMHALLVSVPNFEASPDWLVAMRRSQTTLGSRVDPSWPNGLFAREFVKLTDLSYIGTVYDLDHSERVFQLSQITPAALLDRWCVPDKEWTYTDGWIKVKHKKSALGRFSTVPRSRYFEWRDRTLRQAGMTLDQFAEICASMNDKQLSNSIMMRVFGTGFDSYRGTQTFYCGRLWQTLSPAQKRIVSVGVGVPVATMTEHQRHLYAEVLLRGNRNSGTTSSMDPLEQQITEWRKEVAHPNDIHSATSAVEITDILPLVHEGRATLNVRIERIDALLMQHRAGTFLTKLDAIAHRIAAEVEFDPEEQFKPVMFDVALFTLEPLPGLRRGSEVRCYSTEPNSEFVAYSKLPSHIRERAQQIAQTIRERAGGG